MPPHGDDSCENGACELGECDDVMKARDLVALADGALVYEGQAILLAACATGCHDSSARGAARQGAPLGDDFDLRPLDWDGEEELDPAALEALRVRQADIFVRRKAIWRAVQTGVMALEGEGDDQRDVSPGTVASLDPDCERGEMLPSIRSPETRAALRVWLACGAPFVEANSSDREALPQGGDYGDRFPLCVGAGEGEPTMEEVHAEVLAGCTAGCHEPDGIVPSVDYSSPRAAYESWFGAEGRGRTPPQCDLSALPYVTPGSPDQSYVLAKLGVIDAPICGTTMPIGTPLPAESLDLLVRWIEAGAPAPEDAP